MALDSFLALMTAAPRSCTVCRRRRKRRRFEKRTETLYSSGSHRTRSSSTHRDEVSSEPGVVLDDLVGSHLAALDGDLGVVDVGVLGGGVVSPDDDVLHVIGGNAATHRHLQVRDGRTDELLSVDHFLFPSDNNQLVCFTLKLTLF